MLNDMIFGNRYDASPMCGEYVWGKTGHIHAPSRSPDVNKKNKNSHLHAQRSMKIQPSNHPLNPPRRSLGAFNHKPPNPARLQTPSRHAEPYESRQTQHEDHAERPPELTESVLCVSQRHAEICHY
jgi:hypothetical protein